MLRHSARMLILAVVVLMASVIGCASDESSRSTRSDSPYASGVADSASHGSCH